MKNKLLKFNTFKKTPKKNSSATSQLSGEIFKEPFLDTFLTHLDQKAFSLQPENRSFLPLYTPPGGKPPSFGGASPFEGRGEAPGPRAAFRRKPRGEANHLGESLQSNEGIAQLAKRLLLKKKVEQTLIQKKKKNNQKESVIPLLSKKLASNTLQISTSKNQSKKRDNRAFYPPDKSTPSNTTLHLSVKVGDDVTCGGKIGEKNGIPIVVSASGKIVRISKTQIVIQKSQPVLYYSQANVHVKTGEWVTQGAPILTLTHQTLVTGDIVQGIPRIEQLFEAPHSLPLGLKTAEHLQQTLHSQVREIFRTFWLQAPLPAAVRQSLQQIQQILVESIQKVYLSQGVLIADKHIEIIVRQMTSKGVVLDSGNSGLLLDELLPINTIENANLLNPGRRAIYAPAVIGLTRSALESESFISAASFQETTRVLTRDALVGKSDFLRGLKEKVVIGDIINAGTGLDLYFIYTLLSNTLFDQQEKR